MENTQEYIDILIGLEPVFKKAGELMLQMRETAKSKNKFNTGIAGIDIVTEADTASQEFILSKMAETKLVECQLFAEEDTPSVKKFKGINGLVLTLDPIDGTIHYANNKRFFSTIISLNDKKDFLYTFCNYPIFNWARRIANGKVEDFGKMPEINILPGLNLEKTIAYTVREPKIIDAEIKKELLEQGYKFEKACNITDEGGSCTLLFLDKVAGYYTETPNPYDGTVALHYAQEKNLKIYSTVDISTAPPTDRGPHYRGWYVVLEK
jgi:fructose-1,6-bisphosphatase/inositol monophosphatase family enzyme